MGWRSFFPRPAKFTPLHGVFGRKHPRRVDDALVMRHRRARDALAKRHPRDKGAVGRRRQEEARDCDHGER
jgi:hypothetical protein